MMAKIVKIELPDIIPLAGTWDEYIDTIYKIFKNNFIDNITRYNNKDIKLKWRPIYQNRPSTFYHITHEGMIEEDRTPALRRCERVPWIKPIIENYRKWNLNIWPQKRGTHKRICIWLNLDNTVPIESNLENHYFVILEKRSSHYLLWTTFIPRYNYEIRAKQKEFNKWYALMQKTPERRS